MCPPTGPTVTSSVKEATIMVVVGADVHKRTHTFVAVDEVGRKLGEKIVEATTDGSSSRRCMWARERFGAELVWGIEDCRHLSARLERDLLTAGQKVVRVPTEADGPDPGLGAHPGQVRSDRCVGGGAGGAARTRPAGGLPRRGVAGVEVAGRSARSPCRATDCDDQPAALAGPRTRSRRGPAPASLDWPSTSRPAGAWLDTQPGLVAELARDELADIIRLTDEINALAKRIGDARTPGGPDAAGDARLR